MPRGAREFRGPRAALTGKTTRKTSKIIWRGYLFIKLSRIVINTEISDRPLRQPGRFSKGKGVRPVSPPPRLPVRSRGHIWPPVRGARPLTAQGTAAGILLDLHTRFPRLTPAGKLVLTKCAARAASPFCGLSQGAIAGYPATEAAMIPAFLPVPVVTIGLLILSNVFMTFA